MDVINFILDDKFIFNDIKKSSAKNIVFSQESFVVPNSPVKNTNVHKSIFAKYSSSYKIKKSFDDTNIKQPKFSLMNANLTNSPLKISSYNNSNIILDQPTYPKSNSFSNPLLKIKNKFNLSNQNNDMISEDINIDNDDNTDNNINIDDTPISLAMMLLQNENIKQALITNENIDDVLNGVNSETKDLIHFIIDDIKNDKLPKNLINLKTYLFNAGTEILKNYKKNSHILKEEIDSELHDIVNELKKYQIEESNNHIASYATIYDENNITTDPNSATDSNSDTDTNSDADSDTDSDSDNNSNNDKDKDNNNDLIPLIKDIINYALTINPNNKK